MATNKNALIRYLTIDKCLQNNLRKWTLDGLIDACSDALYEYEGKDSYVSKRTIQLDIQNMRSNKLGYNAPIEVYQRKYYKYSKPNYSITDIPLTEIDLVERLILGFGPSIKVIKPRRLKSRIKKLAKELYQNYFEDVR